MKRKTRKSVQTWTLEPDSYTTNGITGRAVAIEVNNLIRGCEDMLKLPWPKLPRGAG